MNENKHTILFSALDWGLGHTTRSIPILTFLTQKGHPLIIAVEPGSASAAILQESFTEATFLPLKGYGIRYAGNSRFFAFKICIQIPKILRAIKTEHKFVRQVVAQNPEIGMILSDNRYGFYHHSIRSAFITHQLRIAAPFKWLENIIQRINYSYIEKFQELWVPDFPGELNIGGQLSHPDKMPAIRTKYIGLLSRLGNLSYEDSPQSSGKDFPVKYLFLLSGPEPQRSILEAKILELMNWLEEPCILVRGLPAANKDDNDPNARLIAGALQRPRSNLQVIQYADLPSLKRFLDKTEFVVCRSGYSTVMDLIFLGKKGIYIPTQGQTEQEYLAKRLMQLGWGYCFSQDAPDFADALRHAAQFSYHLPTSFNAVKESIFKPQ